jgi:hypothetical protein
MRIVVCIALFGSVDVVPESTAGKRFCATGTTNYVCSLFANDEACEIVMEQQRAISVRSVRRLDISMHPYMTWRIISHSPYSALLLVCNTTACYMSFSVYQILTMIYSLVVATIIALVAAKPLDLPTCSVDCLKAGIEHVGCAADEADCACARANDIDPFVTPCLQGACSENESEKFRTAVVEFCANIRQPIEPTQQNIHEKFENDHWFSGRVPLGLPCCPLTRF